MQRFAWFCLQLLLALPFAATAAKLKWLSGLASLAPRLLPLPRITVPRLASGAITPTTLTLARPTAITARSGLRRHLPWRRPMVRLGLPSRMGRLRLRGGYGYGRGGYGYGRGGYAGRGAYGGGYAADMRHAVTPAELAGAAPRAVARHAADLAAAEPAVVADSVAAAMPVAAVATAVVDTGKIGDLRN
jgi:hypothetical protein